jgi:hypothetical protein
MHASVPPRVPRPPQPMLQSPGHTSGLHNSGTGIPPSFGKKTDGSGVSDKALMSSKVAKIVSEIHKREQQRLLLGSGIAERGSKPERPPGKSAATRGDPASTACDKTTQNRDQDSDASRIADERFEVHPEFPFMPSSVPLMFTVGMASCLSLNPQDRPTFTEVLGWLKTLSDEVAAGQYVDSRGAVQV